MNKGTVAAARRASHEAVPARGGVARRTSQPPSLPTLRDLNPIVGNQAAMRMQQQGGPNAVPRANAPARSPGVSVAGASDHSLEAEADRMGADIGRELGGMREGPLPRATRQVAERHVGPLPDVTLKESDTLAPGVLASAHGSRIVLRPGILQSSHPFHRAAVGHELVHLAQQRHLGPRIQHLFLNGIKLPDVTWRATGDVTTVYVDGVAVLSCPGLMQVSTSFDSATLQYAVVVQTAGDVVPLHGLDFLNAMYPALAGRVVVDEPVGRLGVPLNEARPTENAPARHTRVFGRFGRSKVAVAASSTPPKAPAEGQKPPEAAQGEALVPDDKKTNPYRGLDVAARATKVTELLKRWFTGGEILKVFQASDSEGEFLELGKKVDFGAVLDKMDEWDIVRLAASGPIRPEYRERINRVRADYLEHITRKWGPQRAEIFALYIVDTTTDDDIEAVLKLLASDQELYRSVNKMPTLAKRLGDRGIDLTKFKDRDWKAVDVGTGIYHAIDGILSSSQAARDAEGITAATQGLDLPEPYRKAVSDLDMAAFVAALTPGNIALGVADQAFLGLPSTVKGVVYDLPKSVVGGFEELAQGHVAGGVELLTVPVITVISVALGVRAFRRARVAALLELTGEGQALYGRLKDSIGASGIQRVARYVQKDSAARILVAETGADGIIALALNKGDVAAARLAVTRTQLARQAGAPSKVHTGAPQTAFDRPAEKPYTQPPDMQIIRPGNPLRLETLDPAKRYLWVLDTEGEFRIAAEGQGNMFPRRGTLGRRHPQAGQTPLKHGDLVPGPGGQERGAARIGGELYPQIHNGKPTGYWFMDLNSSYAFARVDGVLLGMENLEAAIRLLGTTGTDISRILPLLGY